MSLVKFEKPTEESILYISENMRQCDITEVKALGANPYQAIMLGVNSCQATVISCNNVPFCIFGITDCNDYGIPWALGTPEIANNAKIMVKYGRLVVSSYVREMQNIVHNDNNVSIRWLRAIGFTIGEPEPLGNNGELFRRFHRCAYQQ